MAVLCIATIGLILAAQNNPAAASTAVVSSHAVAAPAATFPADAPSLGAIPDGPAGGTVCGDYGAGFKDVTFTVTGMTGPLTDVQVSSSITHTWVGDLDAELRSPGNTATKLLYRQVGGTTATACGDDSDLSGAYLLNDAAATTFWTAATTATTVVPAGTYRAVLPLVNTATPITASFTGLTTPQINGTWTLRIRDGGEGDIGSVTAASLILTGGAAVAADAPVDFTGDGKSDYAVVRNTGGGPSGQVTWFILPNNTGAIQAYQWGLATDFFVPEDYDGDGKDDVAVWRPGAATVASFYILNSNGFTARVEAFGQSGDDPSVIADYDNDGKTDIAVYRAGATAGAQSFWYYRTVANGPVSVNPWGLNGDFPAPGDYNGDGRSDFCVQRNFGGGQAVFHIFLNGPNTASQQVFGTPTDVVVPGDYDGDGKTDLATVRGIGGSIVWFWRPSAGGADQQVIFGVSATDFPTQGDYDGDGKTDQAIWRPNADPAQNYFWSRNSTNGAATAVEFGQNGDYPVANYNAH